MSKLVVIAYPDKNTAEEVYETLQKLQTKQLLEIHDAAYATRDKSGKIQLHQLTNLTGAGAASGALWGLLIGALFFAPVFGMLLGAGTGAIAGKASDYGIDDNFMDELSKKLKNNESAIFMLVDNVVADKVIPEIDVFGGEVIQTSLPRKTEERLQQALTSGPKATSATPLHQ